MRGVRPMKSRRRVNQRTTHMRGRLSHETPTVRPLMSFSEPQRRAAARDVVPRSGAGRHEGPPWRSFARFLLVAGGASVASALLIEFVAQLATNYRWTLEAPGPVALCLGTVLGITLTWLYIRDFEPLDPTLTRRLTICGVLTATTTLVVWRLVLRLPLGTDSLGLLLGFVLGVTLSWIYDRHLRKP